MRRTTYFFFASLLLTLGCGGDDPQLVDSERGPPERQTGASCSRDNRCESDNCLNDWPRGYCTSECNDDSECFGDDAFCLDFLDDRSQCLDACTRSIDCRLDYRCISIGGTRACVPNFVDGPAPGFEAGECSDQFPCNEGLNCATGLTGGYCFRESCERCNASGVCTDEVPGVDKTICAPECRTISDCRDGYICSEVSDGKTCLPADGSGSGVPWDITKDVLGVSCDATSLGDDEFELTFNIGNGTSFIVTTYVETGSLLPLAIETPSETIDLVETYFHHNVASQDLGNVRTPTGRHETVSMAWSILVPYAPQFANFVQSGTYKIRVRTQGTTPCVYVTEQPALGTKVNLNVYFTGTDLTADAAATDNDFQEVIATVRGVFEAAGLSLDDVQYFDLPVEIALRYNEIEDISGIDRLTAFGDARGPTLDDHLVVDVFMVNEILGSVLGISAGLPGAPGMHGNIGNGAVFSTLDIGFDNGNVGYIMAHEIGHYLGLRHTTESIRGTADDELFAALGLTDPLSDTPECDSPQQQFSACPDFTNLMFPFVPPPQNRVGELSPMQIEALQLNPLLR